MGPGSRRGRARCLPRPLCWGHRAGCARRTPAKEETQAETGTGAQAPIPAVASALSKTPTPMRPPPPALRPRLRILSHFRHRHRPERKCLSRGVRRQGCEGGAPPQPCLTYGSLRPGLGSRGVNMSAPYGCRHLWVSGKEKDGAMLNPGPKVSKPSSGSP